MSVTVYVVAMGCSSGRGWIAGGRCDAGPSAMADVMCEFLRGRIENATPAVARALEAVGVLPGLQAPRG
jgi:hypothetical protein